LGYGNTNNLGDNPGEVNGGLNAAVIETKKIVAGYYHTCALKYDGSVWCWGYNAFGQLGAGDTQNRRDGVNNGFAIPALGTGRHAIDITAGGYSTCALLDNITVKCWGYNGLGQLGLGDTASRGVAAGQMGDLLPAVDMGLAGWGIKQIALGGYHVCAVRANNSWPKCWGYNYYGQLGLGDSATRGDNPGEMGTALPFLPGGNTSWQLALGAFHTCAPAWQAFAGRSGVKCWGYNGYGQLGQGDTANRGDTPGEVGSGAPPNINLGIEPSLGLPHRVQAVSAGFYHTCALLGDATLKCWGYNGYGQLGLGDTTTRGDTPANMGDALPIVDL
jgi:alpha-tubulin suppressor-like RCC1 family protein